MDTRGPNLPPASCESSYVLVNHQMTFIFPKNYQCELYNNLKWPPPTGNQVIVCWSLSWSKDPMNQVLISEWGVWEEHPVLLPITSWKSFSSRVFLRLLICEPSPLPWPEPHPGRAGAA